MRSETMLLRDILESAERITSYIENETFDSFESNSMRQDAVLRCFAIIGEAVSGLPEATRRSIPQLPWSKIRGLRNIIIHHYFDVELRIIWDTATKEIPVLMDIIRPLLPSED